MHSALPRGSRSPGSGTPWQAPRWSSATAGAGAGTAGRQLPRRQAEALDSSSPVSLWTPGPSRAEPPAVKRQPRRLFLRPPPPSAPQSRSQRSRHRRPRSGPAVHHVSPAAARPPHLRVRRHPAGAHSGTASGALPGHSGAHAARRRLAPPGGRAAKRARWSPVRRLFSSWLRETLRSSPVFGDPWVQPRHPHRAVPEGS